MNTTKTETTAPTLSFASLDAFTKGYIRCALWSSTDDGYALDRKHTETDLAPSVLESMASDCREFQDSFRCDLDACGLSLERQGHDFWLNRNGHGVGFWDEYSNTNSECEVACNRLSIASEESGTSDLYVGDNGLIYVA